MEKWKTPLGFHGTYLISDKGRVMRTGPGRGATPGAILRHTKTHDGYHTVALRHGGEYHRRYVHVLVGEAFICERVGSMQFNHIDGKKDNNRLSNLEAVTPKQNMEHAKRMGLLGVPRKLSQIEADSAVDDWESGRVTDIYRLAGMYGVGRTTMQKVIKGKY